MAAIDNKYKSMGLPMNIKRGNPWPLDASSVWYSYDEMKAYAEDLEGVAYVGQVLALVDEANNTAEAYIIADKAGRLEPIGSGSLVDNKTIEIDSESESLMLKDFGKRFYKYIPESKDEEGNVLIEAAYQLVTVDAVNPWKAGLEPRVVLEDGVLVLGWYEPNPTTIEGVNNQVSSLQTTVVDLQNSVADLTEAVETTIPEELNKKANAADVFTKVETLSEIANAVSAADHLQRKIVTSYTDIQNFIDEKGAAEASKYIFMVPETDSTADGNVYEEYMVINGVIEVVGKWSTDLSGYVTTEALETALEDYVTETSLQTTLNNYSTVESLQNLANEIAGVTVALDGKVDKVDGARLITAEEIEKLTNLKLDAEANYVKSVSEDFSVVEGLLSLNKELLDLSNNTDFKALESSVETINNNVNANIASIEALNNTVASNTGAIEALQTAKVALQEAIAKNTEDISTVSGKVLTLEEQLSGLETSVEKNTDDISTILAGLGNYVLKETYDKDIAEIRDILTWKTLEEPVA